MMDLVYSPDWMSLFEWTVIVSFFISFLVSFGMGANDCANAYGTSVGSGVLRLWQAYTLSSIFNTLGACLLGYKVTTTIRKSIFAIEIYDVFAQHNQTTDTYLLTSNCSENGTNIADCTKYTSAEFMLGELGALTGAAVWLILASVTKMPVSATQSIVGASIGFSLVLKGTAGIRWSEIIDIVLSWIASPLLSGLFASTFYIIIKFAVMRRKEPFEAALKLVPVFVWFTLAINLFSVFYDGSKYLHFNEIPWWGAILISNGIGLVVALFLHFVCGGFMRRRALKLYENDIKFSDASQRTDTNASGQNRENTCGLGQAIDKYSAKEFDNEKTRESSTSNASSVIDCPPKLEQQKELPTMPDDRSRASSVSSTLNLLIAPVEEDARAIKVFFFLQVLSSSFLSFSNGSNNTANSVGPLVGVWLAYKTGSASTDGTGRGDLELLLLFGALSTLVGLWCLGHRVIRTVGTEITSISAPSGFAAELGSAFTVLIASKIGIPMSTTHCAVGAVVSVGLCRSSREGVSWSKLRSIVIAWLVTLPFAGAVAALVAYLLVHFILGTV